MLNAVYPTFLKNRAGLGLLLLRVAVGSAFAWHGLFKLQFSPLAWMGPNVPIPGFLQLAAAVSEFAGGLLFALGFLTPLASLMLIGTMIGAIGLVHFPMGHPFVSADPAKPSFELAFTYLVSALSVLFAGPGVYSVDALLFNQKTVTQWTGKAVTE